MTTMYGNQSPNSVMATILPSLTNSFSYDFYEDAVMAGIKLEPNNKNRQKSKGSHDEGKSPVARKGKSIRLGSGQVLSRRQQKQIEELLLLSTDNMDDYNSEQVHISPALTYMSSDAKKLLGISLKDDEGALTGPLDTSSINDSRPRRPSSAGSSGGGSIGKLSVSSTPTNFQRKSAATSAQPPAQSQRPSPSPKAVNRKNASRGGRAINKQLAKSSESYVTVPTTPTSSSAVSRIGSMADGDFQDSQPVPMQITNDSPLISPYPSPRTEMPIVTEGPQLAVTSTLAANKVIDADEFDDIKTAVNRVVQGLTVSLPPKPVLNKNSRGSQSKKQSGRDSNSSINVSNSNSFLMTNSFLGAVSDTASTIVEGFETKTRQLRSFDQYKAYSYSLAEEPSEEEPEPEVDDGVSITTRGAIETVPMSTELRRVLGLPSLPLPRTASMQNLDNWQPPDTYGLANSEPIIKTTKNVAVRASTSIIPISNKLGVAMVQNEEGMGTNSDSDNSSVERPTRARSLEGVAMSTDLRRVLGLKPLPSQPRLEDRSDDWKPPRTYGLSNSEPIIKTSKNTVRSKPAIASPRLRENMGPTKRVLLMVKEEDESSSQNEEEEEDSVSDGEDSHKLEDVPMSAELRKLFGLPPLDLNTVASKTGGAEWRPPQTAGLGNSQPLIFTPSSKVKPTPPTTPSPSSTPRTPRGIYVKVQDIEEEDGRSASNELDDDFSGPQRPSLDQVPMSSNLKRVLGLSSRPMSANVNQQSSWKPPSTYGLANSEPIIRTPKNVVSP